MAYIEKTIIVEEVIKDILSYLPKFKNSKGTEFNHTFSYGTNKHLIEYLKRVKDVYPLIWLEAPFTEDHEKRKVNINDISLIIAIESYNAEINEQSMDFSFKNILIPIFDNIKYLFNKTPKINIIDNNYNIVKFFNYGDVKSKNSTSVIRKYERESTATAVWDALKITFSCEINDKCVKLKKL